MRLSRFIGEKIKKFATYLPGRFNPIYPRYPYKIDTGELCSLVQLIRKTEGNEGCIVEVGVARGYTSVFLLEALKETNDSRLLYMMDTFSGFTKESVRYEKENRKKYFDYELYFRYHNEKLLEKHVRSLGYKNFRIIKGDASKFDFSKISPISVMLLDIDLYLPTLNVLINSWPHVASGGGIVIDDCLEDSPWDGALEAVNTFCAQEELEWTRVGRKGALIVKN